MISRLRFSFKLSLMFLILSLLVLIITGCVPPMRFSHSIDVPSPDGKTSLEVSSVRWTDFGLVFGPEPPRNMSCEGSIRGWRLLSGTYFKINIDANFKYSTFAQDKIGVVWSPDSNYFALITPLDMKIYDRDGDIAKRYDLGLKERISSVHWKKDENNGFYFVVKNSKRSLIPLETYFDPIGFRIIYSKPNTKKNEEVFSRHYIGKNTDSFVFNDLGAIESGQEFQEISPNSKYFIFSDEEKLRYYDFSTKREGVLFNCSGRLSWIWWINNECVLVNITRDKNQYIMYNMTTGEQKDLTEMIVSLPYSKRYIKDWYKSLECH